MIQDNGHPTKYISFYLQLSKVIIFIYLINSIIFRLTAYAWIESRTPKLALQFYQAAVAALQRAGIPVNALALVAQDC